jgi:hypothetical protein
MPLAQRRDLEQLMELEKGFDTQAAMAEAKRCLNCGLICYQHEGNRQQLQQIGETVNA